MEISQIALAETVYDVKDATARQECSNNADNINATNEVVGQHTAHLNRIDERLNGDDASILSLNNTTEGHTNDINGINGRLDGIDSRLSGDDTSINSINQTLNTHQSEIDTANSGINSNRDSINSMYSNLVDVNNYQNKRGVTGILAIGDSYNVADTGRESTWGNTLNNFINCPVYYNTGIGGAGFATGENAQFINQMNSVYDSMPQADRNKISHIIVGGGFNDCWHNFTIGDITGNIIAFCNRAKELFPNALVCCGFIGVYNSSEQFLNTFVRLDVGRDAYRFTDTGMRNRPSNYVYMENAEHILKHTAIMGDAIHPNSIGSIQIAKQFAQFLNGGSIQVHYSQLLIGNSNNIPITVHIDNDITTVSFDNSTLMNINGNYNYFGFLYEQTIDCLNGALMGASQFTDTHPGFFRHTRFEMPMCTAPHTDGVISYNPCGCGGAIIFNDGDISFQFHSFDTGLHVQHVMYPSIQFTFDTFTI